MPIKFDTTTRTPLTEGGEGYIYEYNGKIIKTFKQHIDITAKERTDEEWEEYFAIAESLRRSRELRERRNRKYKGNPYISTYRNKGKRRYRK